MRNCRLCAGSLSKVMDMRPLPPVDCYTKERVTHPLTPADVYQCQSCQHVQMIDVIPPDQLFGNYLFRTGDNMKAYYESYADECMAFKPHFVVEIGSNDGTLLKAFKARGVPYVLGVDPANIETEVETWHTYFDFEVADSIAGTYSKADLICANHVFAHTDDLLEMIGGIKHLLSPDGVFVFEAAYLWDMLKGHYFDTVYHEHLSYHHLKPLVRTLREYNLSIFAVQHNPCKQGSIRGFVRHGTSLFDPDEPDVTPKSFDAINNRIELERAKVLGIELAIGYGASSSSTATTYQLDLQDRLAFVVDDNPRKHGMYAPCGAQVLHPDNLLHSDLPIIVLAPRYKEAIISKHPTLKARFV